ncbi:MAG: prepilin-type N-terminal cleavage/methylation domain-containing protein [Pyrinomonadaceae bacterium]
MIDKNNFCADKIKKNESGFSLIEVTIALVILLVSVLAIFGAFTYAVKYNTGNSRRSQALSVFQQQIELTRSAKFTPTIYNDPLLTGGFKTPIPVTSKGDNNTYLVETIVDNDPFTAGVQSANDITTKLKEITITITPQTSSESWVSAYKTKVVFRRTRAN